MSELLSATSVSFKNSVAENSVWEFSVGDCNEYGHVESISLNRVDSTCYNIIVMHSLGQETADIKNVEFKNVSELVIITLISGDEPYEEDDSAE